MSDQTLEQRIANLEAATVDEGTKKLRARWAAEHANAEEAQREADRDMREMAAAIERHQRLKAQR